MTSTLASNLFFKSKARSYFMRESRLIKNRSKKAGLPPGTPVYIGERKSSEKSGIHLITYDGSGFDEKTIQDIREVESLFASEKNKKTTFWLDVEGVSDTKLLTRIGTIFGIHPLVIEDITDTDQRAKTEDYDNYIYVVLHMLSHEKAGIRSEQVSLVFGDRFVLSFQEGQKGDLFDPIRNGLRSGKGRIRSMGADYLAYSIIDATVDHHFAALEKLGGELEIMEEQLVKNPSSKTLGEIHHAKKNLLLLRKSFWPLREAIGALQRSESPLISEQTGIYLRDVYDHTIHIIDTVELFRDIASGMLDIYLSSVSNRINEVMKVLTIIATVFMPLTFIVGWYGMNFKLMPELESPYGYPAVIVVMTLVTVVMLIYFKRKKWI